MYFAVYDTEQEAIDAERIGFHFALHSIASLYEWTHLYNNGTNESMLLEDITVDYITTNPNHIGFLSRTKGELRYDIPPMCLSSIVHQIVSGEFIGKFALRVQSDWSDRSLDSGLSNYIGMANMSDILQEEQ